MNLSWMAWTPQTATFFILIFVTLVIMTILAVKKPELPRIGILRIETTRGDRLFLSLLGSAFISIGYLWIFGPPIYGGLIVCFFYAVAVFWFV